MGISVKLGAGAALVAIGLAGLAFAMPIVSDGASSDGLVYKEADVPPFPRSLIPYVAVEVASAAVFTGGIALCAVGLGEALVGADPPSKADTKGKTDGNEAKGTEAA